MMICIIIIGYLLAGFVALTTGYKTNSYSINNDKACMQKFATFFVWPVVLFLWGSSALFLGVDKLARKLS